MKTLQRAVYFAFLVSLLVLPQVLLSQTAGRPTPSRIVSAIDNSQIVRLEGDVHPLAQPEFDRGVVSPQMPMTHMLLLLQRSPAQESALESYMAQQTDRSSPNYHNWLTPTEFGKLYGPSDADIAQVTGWLQSQGLTVNHVSNGRVTIEFSGAAAQVQSAFHTEIHNYLVKGETHYANANEPAIPQALAPVVAGVASLNNFFAKPQSLAGRRVRRDPRTGVITPVDASGQPSAEFTRVNSSGNTLEDITPYDFATIYNVLPLWNANINGAGQTIAIAGESDINKTDVATFQSSFGLANNPPTVIYPNGNPGTNSNEQEQELDVEWAGAVAPGATIELVVIGSSGSTGGFQLAAQYVIDNRTATILSESYGQCEQSLGTTGNSTINALWQQGAAEGISIFGSAGDQGSAGCENSDLYQYNPATTGLNVNGLTSSPYITAVGGTDFNWQNSPLSTYWSTTNASNGSTALGYIPEVPWNATCTSQYLIGYFSAASAEANCNTLAGSTTQSNLVYITGGSGGVSACTTVSRSGACSGGYAKPSWQTGTGVPADGKRDVPDVALFAGAGIPDGIPASSYLICYSGSYPCSYGNATDVVYQEIGGTSVSSPAMAGIMALVQQKVGSPQGLANPIFYQLAAAESNLSACNTNTVTAGNSCVFYDTTTGSNAMACKSGSTNCVVKTSGDTVGVLSGYSATSGYDQATGLGSVNAANLVNAWAAVPSPTLSFSIPNQTYSTTPFTVSATSNSSGTIGYTVISGPATITGSTLTMTGAGVVTVLAYQTAAGGYASGSATASFTISPTASNVSWSPSSTTLFAGTALGTGILDAKGSVAGTIVYSAVLGSGTPTTVTSTSTLASVGVYAITATLTPTNTGYSSSTATINLTVTSAYVWAVNPSGSISEFYGNEAVTTSAIAGGGIGAAVDHSGNLWTINSSGSSLAEFNSSGSLVQSGITGGGISGATALAIDGTGAIWLANNNNSVSVVSNGAATSPAGGYTAGNLSSPNGIAVDISGNVWISNTGNNSVTEILGAAAPVSPTATAVKNNTLGARP